MKILVRCGVSPLENFSPGKLIVRNAFGGNIGNFAYQYGVFRTLASDTRKLIPDRYYIDREKITSNVINKINKDYDAYVCPMANAFRDTFIDRIEKYTDFIKKLEIPIIIAGIGVSTDVESDGYENFQFDDVVHDFISVIRDNGTIIGVRGNITGNYLSNLGFKEKKDFMVIGCPGMYSFGDNIKIRNTEINNSSKIAINSGNYGLMINEFISKTMKEFLNYYFIPQWRSELRLTYLGRPSLKFKSELYPRSIDSKPYKKNRVRAPINAQGWINFMKNMDLSFGARIHGNIMATIAGTPSIVIVKDGRMKELGEYHNLTRIYEKDLKEFNSLSDIIKTVDFHSPEDGHENRFKNYLKFWKKNKIETVFDNDFHLKNLPIDNMKENISNESPIETISYLSEEEINKRFSDFKSEKKKFKKEKYENNLEKESKPESFSLKLKNMINKYKK